jgi:hypothetical protein
LTAQKHTNVFGVFESPKDSEVLELTHANSWPSSRGWRRSRRSSPPSAAAQGGVIVSGTLGSAETDSLPDQQQHLLGEYWPDRAGVRHGRSGESHQGAVRLDAGSHREGAVDPSIRPEGTLPAGIKSNARNGSRGSCAAPRCSTRTSRSTRSARVDLQQFEFHSAIADGWLALADDRKSSPGSLRSGDGCRHHQAAAGQRRNRSRRTLSRIASTIGIPNDPAILLVLRHGQGEKQKKSRRKPGSDARAQWPSGPDRRPRHTEDRARRGADRAAAQLQARGPLPTPRSSKRGCGWRGSTR